MITVPLAFECRFAPKLGEGNIRTFTVNTRNQRVKGLGDMGYFRDNIRICKAGLST